MLSYHGVLAPHTIARREVVPQPIPTPQVAFPFDKEASPPKVARHPLTWLLQSVFKEDVTVCPEYGARLRLRKIVKDHEEVRLILGHPEHAPVGHFHVR